MGEASRMRELGLPIQRNTPQVYVGPEPVREHGRVLVGKSETEKAFGLHGELPVRLEQSDFSYDSATGEVTSGEGWERALPPVFSGKMERTEE